MKQSILITNELNIPPIEFEWNPEKEFNIGPEWPLWAHDDIKSISIKEFLEELESHDKQRRKHFSVL